MEPMSMYVGEFVGTLLLLLFGNGICMTCSLKHSYGKGAGWLAICFGWGMAVMLAVYSVGWVSGAHLNPAVTLGLAATGRFSWGLVPGYLIAQFLGAFAGAALAYLAYKIQMDNEPEEGVKLGVFCTGPSIDSPIYNIIMEIIGTALLLIGILAIGYDKAGATGGMIPFLVGLLIMLIGLAVGGGTGFAINPARDLGPRIAHAVLPIKGKGGSNWGYAWIPVVAPVIGGILGAVLFDVFINIVS